MTRTPRKAPFVQEPVTKPGGSRSRHDAPTLPPPKRRAQKSEPELAKPEDDEPETPRTSRPPKTSAVRPKQRTSIPAATVDEVTADLKKDPRAED